MIVTIIGALVLSVLITLLVLLRKRKVGDDLAIACFIFGISYLVIMGLTLRAAYIEPDHGGITIDDVDTYAEAVKWNSIEEDFAKENERWNNLIFRFTIREPNFIDIGDFEE